MARLARDLSFNKSHFALGRAACHLAGRVAVAYRCTFCVNFAARVKRLSPLRVEDVAPAAATSI